MINKTIYLCILVLVSVVVVLPAQSDPIQNGNFMGYSSWTLAGGLAGHNDAYSHLSDGSGSMYIYNSGSGNMFYQLVDVDPFTNYTLKFWTMSEVGTTEAAIEAGIADPIDPSMMITQSYAPASVNTWEEQTLMFNSGSYSDIIVGFRQGLSFGGYDYYCRIDDVSMEAATVPEPASMLAVLGGVLGLGVFRKRR